MRPGRNAFTLLSVLAAIPLLILAFTMAHMATRMLLERAPAVGKRLSTYAALRSLVRQIEKDVEAVEPAAMEQLSIIEGRLVLPGESGPVVYRLEEGSCVRSLPDSEGDDPTRTWRLEGGRIQWRIEGIDDRLRGVHLEIQADNSGDAHLLVFENSYLIFPLGNGGSR
jgi:type II secretory pathway component PulJ